MSGTPSITYADYINSALFDHYFSGHDSWPTLVVSVLIIASAVVYLTLFNTNKQKHLFANNPNNAFDNNVKQLIQPNTDSQFVCSRRRQMVEVVDSRLDMNYSNSQDGYMEQEEEWEREGLLYVFDH